MSWVANARMYSVAPGAAAAWKALFARLAERSGIALETIDHAYPAALEALWARPDLGAAFMCGWPYAREGGDRPIVATPVPASEGRPVYRTHLVARPDAGFRRMEDSFGGRLAYTAESSHSGFNAVRHHLRLFPDARYGALVGPLTTPRRVVEAIAGGRADLGPVDSYAYDLLVRHDPALMDGIRVVASTEAAPMPPLVAARGCPAEVCDRLSAALMTLGPVPELCLAGFARTSPADYAVTEAWAVAAGHGALAAIA